MMVLSQAADNMAEAMIDLVNLSKLAWKATNGNTEKQETKQRMERARQPDGCASLCRLSHFTHSCCSHTHACSMQSELHIWGCKLVMCLHLVPQAGALLRELLVYCHFLTVTL